MKKIVIEPFNLVDYHILLEVVSEYIREHQLSRDKFEWEKDMFDLNNVVYSLECFKHPVRLNLKNHWKPFWVKVSESRTQYKFKIWYA